MKIKLNSSLFIFLMYVFILWEGIQTIVPFFSYWDELFVPFFLVIFFIKRGRLFNQKRTLIIPIIMLFIAGLFGTILFRFQVLGAVIEDCLVILKFPCALGLFYLLSDGNEFERYHSRIFIHLKLQIYFLLLMVVANRFFHFFPTYGNVLGIFMGDSLFYTHPTYFAGCIGYLLCMCILLGEYYNVNLLVLILLILGVDTLRFKMIAWCVITFFLCWFVLIEKRRISFPKLSILGIIALLIGRNKIVYYFVQLRGTSARSALVSASFKIMKDFFPIGTGFGSFGSGASAKYYSQVYGIYNLNLIYGLGSTHTRFITDTFWPMIIGEFGAIGLLSFMSFLLLIFLDIQKLFSINRRLYCCCFCAFVYLLVSSVAEPIYVNGICIPFAFLIAYGCKYYSNIRSNNNVK